MKKKKGTRRRYGHVRKRDACTGQGNVLSHQYWTKKTSIFLMRILAINPADGLPLLKNLSAYDEAEEHPRQLDVEAALKIFSPMKKWRKRRMLVLQEENLTDSLKMTSPSRKKMI